MSKINLILNITLPCFFYVQNDKRKFNYQKHPKYPHFLIFKFPNSNFFIPKRLFNDKRPFNDRSQMCHSLITDLTVKPQIGAVINATFHLQILAICSEICSFLFTLFYEYMLRKCVFLAKRLRTVSKIECVIITNKKAASQNSNLRFPFTMEASFKCLEGL